MLLFWPEMLSRLPQIASVRCILAICFVHFYKPGVEFRRARESLLQRAFYALRPFCTFRIPDHLKSSGCL